MPSYKYLKYNYKVQSLLLTYPLVVHPLNRAVPPLVQCNRGLIDRPAVKVIFREHALPAVPESQVRLAPIVGR